MKTATPPAGNAGGPPDIADDPVVDAESEDFDPSYADLPVPRRRLGRRVFAGLAVLIVAGAAVSFVNLYFAITREPDRNQVGAAVAGVEPAQAAPVKDEARITPTPQPNPPVQRAPVPSERVTTVVESMPSGAPQSRQPVALVDEAAVEPVVEDVAEEIVAEAEAPAAAGAVIRRSVNLRSGPNNGASVLGVVEAGTPVSVIACDFWCEIAVGGRRGFVFRSFLSTR